MQKPYPASARSPGALEDGDDSCPTCGGGGRSSESEAYGSKCGGGSGGGENILEQGGGGEYPSLELPLYVRVGDGGRTDRGTEDFPRWDDGEVCEDEKVSARRALPLYWPARASFKRRPKHISDKGKEVKQKKEKSCSIVVSVPVPSLKK
jgi:hypothetical protein